MWIKNCSFIDTVCNKLCRYPTFFDDVVARLLPVIPLIVYRLIENDAFDPAERVLAICTPLLAYNPLRFTFVRDILAYFYGHLPAKLIVRILNVLDVTKVFISPLPRFSFLFSLSFFESFRVFFSFILHFSVLITTCFRSHFQSHSHSILVHQTLSRAHLLSILLLFCWDL